MKSLKSFCNVCGGLRNQHVLHELKTSGSEEIEGGYSGSFSVSWSDTYYMLRCAGCDEVSLQIDKWFSEHDGVETLRFPPKIFRQKPRWFSEITDFMSAHQEFGELLNEVYVCLQNDCPRAAAMVCRALLERIFVKEVGDQKSFQKNLQVFEEQGKISATQKSFLTDVLEAGHASIHRGYRPSQKDLSTIVDITENLMEIIFVHEAKVSDLKKKVPPRKK